MSDSLLFHWSKFMPVYYISRPLAHLEHGTVRERITRENLDIIRKLIGESTNLNQLARRANAYGFYRVADECSTAVQQISQLIKQLKDDR